MDSGRRVLCGLVVVLCLLCVGVADAQCPGGQCRPVQKATVSVLKGVTKVAQPVVKRAESRRGIFRRIFRRR